MSSCNIKTFIAIEQKIEFYNGQAIIDLPFEFVYDNDDETAFTFPAEAGLFLTIYDERGGIVRKEFTKTTGLSRNSNVMVLNANATNMTFEDTGKYYYEIGYIRSGGYEIVLGYGDLYVI